MTPVPRLAVAPALLRVAVLAASLAAVSLAFSPAAAEVLPGGGGKDARIRTAVYDPDQVFVVETDMRHATTIHFGPGERFAAVVVGDTESFQVDPITDLGNVLSIKPHVGSAATNMTVITNRRRYSFHLVEGRHAAEFYQVRFRYPDDERRLAAEADTAKGAGVLGGLFGGRAPNFVYLAAGDQDFRPTEIWDDGRYTYFKFEEGSRQPAVFKADARGRERTVNWTQQGDTVRVLGLSQFWTLRIGDDAICVVRDAAAVQRALAGA